MHASFDSHTLPNSLEALLKGLKTRRGSPENDARAIGFGNFFHHIVRPKTRGKFIFEGPFVLLVENNQLGIFQGDHDRRTRPNQNSRLTTHGSCPLLNLLAFG